MTSTDWIDHLPPNIRQFVTQLSALPDFPYHLARFARLQRRQQLVQRDINVELARRAYAMAPDDARVRDATAWAKRPAIEFHFPMVHDVARNAVYERALQQFVTPETTVLEIGTGSGILAMIAARAGAQHVYTCEAVPLVAELARQNILRNGFADRVTIIPKKSTDLVIGVDLPERANLLVSEILASDLLGEAVLPAIEDAKTRLLTTDAHILPSQIALRAALVGGPEWTERCRMGEICGLDLSAFDQFAPQTVRLRGGGTLDDAFSDEVDLFRFDLRTPDHYPPTQRQMTLRARRDGVIDGLLQWIWFCFSDALQYDNKPPRQSHRKTILHVFRDRLRVCTGDQVCLNIAHYRTGVRIWPN